MPIMDWPQTPEHHKLAYNLLMVVLTVGGALAWQMFGLWGVFAAAMVWVILIFWDMYLRVALMPDTEVSDEQYFDTHLDNWLSSNQHKYDKRLSASEARNLELEKRVAKLQRDLEDEARRGK